MVNHPHQKVIENMDIYAMVSLINDSKMNYVKENLGMHLHTSQIVLLKEANKHSKPHHKSVRVAQYKKLQETPEELDGLFELHKKLYIKKYQKLEKKGLVIVDTECEDLPYDVTLTDEGVKLLSEIIEIEKQWQEKVLKDVPEDQELTQLLRKVTHNALPINYAHKKQQKFVF